MNKQLTALIMAGSLILPIGAMAEETEDLTIRVMEMNENSVEAVTRNIELPDAASENAAEGVQTANQNRVRNREMIEGGVDQLSLQEQQRLHERLEEQEQDRVQMRENDREQLQQQQQEQMRDQMPDTANPGMGANTAL